jgi:RNA polymerase sigma-70 factor, ECF subfamily
MPPSNSTEGNRAADMRLVERCRRGEPGAFEELYGRFSTRVYSVACRMCGSAADGEDLLQEIFLLVHRKIGSFKGEAALSTWIYRLATNACLDFLRSRQHRQHQLTEALDEQAAPKPSGSLRVERIDLERAIAQLPAGYRAAFVLHDVEGFGHAEIAEMLGVAEGTSKSQVHKARLRIRELLATAVGSAAGSGSV